MKEHDRIEASEGPTQNTETSNIRVYLDRDGVWFCLIDADDDRLLDHLEQIELQLSKADEEDRISETLVPEPEREKPAPVVGTVRHADGEIFDVSFDLSNWYGNE